MTTQTIRVTGLQQALDDLTIFQRARIPGSVAWALDQFGYFLRQNEREEMEKTFNRKSSFTLKAPLTIKPTKENPRLIFFLRDQADGGNAPERYLAPQVTGGPVYVTRFSRSLRRAGRIPAQAYALHWANPNYKPTLGFTSAVLASVNANVGPVARGAQYSRNLKSANKYFILGDPSQKSQRARRGQTYKDNGFRGWGIYSRKGGQLDLVYRIVGRPISVPKKYDWTNTRMQRLANEHLPRLLFEKLSQF